MASAMDIDDEEIDLPTSSSGKGEKKRFEVKKVRTNIHESLIKTHLHIPNDIFKASK